MNKLIDAVKRGDTTLIQELLQKGRDANGVGRWYGEPIIQAIKSGRLDLIQLLLDGKAEINIFSNYGIDPLSIAVASGRVDIVRFLLERGASIDFCLRAGHCLLHTAVSTRNPAMVRLMLEAGIDINQFGCFNHHGLGFLWVTALYRAVWLDYKDMILLLIELGADPNIEDIVGRPEMMCYPTNPAMQLALSRDNAETAAILLRRNAT